jgi:NTE family protein
MTPDELTAAIDRVYASGFFERVTYQVKPAEARIQGNDSTLIISVTETSGIYLKLGFSYDTDMNAALLGNITIRNLAGQGSKFSIDARLSEFPGFLGSYFIHSGIPKPGIGFGVKIHYDRFNINTYKLGNIESIYNYHNTGADLYAQTMIFNYVALGIGVQKDMTFIRTQVSPSDPRKDNTEAMNYYAYIVFDNLDSTLYPSSGLLFYGDGKYLTNHLTMLTDTNRFPAFFKYTVKLKAYIPLYLKRMSLFFGFTGGFIFAHEPYYLKYDLLTGPVIYRNNLPFIYENYMGGLMTYTKNCFPFTGLHFMQINGKQMLVGDVGLQIEFWKDLFCILRGNVGRVKNKFGDLFREKNLIIEQVYGSLIPTYRHLKNDLVYGYGFTLSYNSLIGPIEATLMRGSESDKFMFHFNIGYRI